MDELRVGGGHVDLDDLVVVNSECEVAVCVKQTVFGHDVMGMLIMNRTCLEYPFALHLLEFLVADV